MGVVFNNKSGANSSEVTSDPHQSPRNNVLDGFINSHHNGSPSVNNLPVNVEVHCHGLESQHNVTCHVRTHTENAVKAFDTIEDECNEWTVEVKTTTVPSHVETPCHAGGARRTDYLTELNEITEPFCSIPVEMVDKTAGSPNEVTFHSKRKQDETEDGCTIKVGVTGPKSRTPSPVVSFIPNLDIKRYSQVDEHIRHGNHSKKCREDVTKVGQEPPVESDRR